MPQQHYDILFTNGTCVLPAGIHDCDIALNDGRIAAIGSLEQASAEERIDCSGLHILPGVIDSQVHFREPGMDHKETLRDGMRAAAAGGVTSIFEMPNTNPLTTGPDALQDKLDRAAAAPSVNYAFYFGGTAENAANLSEWENLAGVCGIKIFMGASTGHLLSETDDKVDAVLRHGRRVVAAHAEDEAIMRDNRATIIDEDGDEVTKHPQWRSVESCLSATQRLVRIARAHGRPVHVLHITTAEEMSFLARNKDIASVEVLANHLTLHAPECYETLGTRAQQNPPIRDKTHQDALWRAIADGTVDILASDHAPHTWNEKDTQYPHSPSGTPGVQTLLPVMLNHVNEGRLSLMRLVDLLCHGPQRIHRIARKGRLAVGYDADLSIVDLKARHTIRNAHQYSRSGWTPYDGMQVTGKPVITVINGQQAMRDGALTGIENGRRIRFIDTLPAEQEAEQMRENHLLHG